ncbi:hypothetical protein RHSP_31937 [Rhizobium freirei PRF 81]|uniref:Uncharacterized protein n=1 Tax=Rhizobium freirei PRF 81 TaxID=363754 RepID=N6V4Z5_9HYPH|nr:hypothetical protein RHSP_31937 [Rhizobium freirei PRF 81]
MIQHRHIRPHPPVLHEGDMVATNVPLNCVIGLPIPDAGRPVIGAAVSAGELSLASLNQISQGIGEDFQVPVECAVLEMDILPDDTLNALLLGRHEPCAVAEHNVIVDPRQKLEGLDSFGIVQFFFRSENSIHLVRIRCARDLCAAIVEHAGLADRVILDLGPSIRVDGALVHSTAIHLVRFLWKEHIQDASDFRMHGAWEAISRSPDITAVLSIDFRDKPISNRLYEGREDHACGRRDLIGYRRFTNPCMLVGGTDFFLSFAADDSPRRFARLALPAR